MENVLQKPQKPTRARNEQKMSKSFNEMSKSEQKMNTNEHEMIKSKSKSDEKKPCKIYFHILLFIYIIARAHAKKNGVKNAYFCRSDRLFLG